MNSKINSFIKLLISKKLTLALAESVTCGLATHQLSTGKGTSEVLKGSIICYTPEVKIELLKIPKRLIEKYTCESMEVTDALAKNLPKLIPATIHAAITGLASGGGTETKDKPVGTIFLSMKYGNKTFREEKRFKGSPLEIRKKACMALYDFILKNIH